MGLGHLLILFNNIYQRSGYIGQVGHGVGALAYIVRLYLSEIWLHWSGGPWGWGICSYCSVISIRDLAT